MRYTAFRSLSLPVETRIDRASGLITGVSLISIGAAKGHGNLVDGTTLEQVAAAIKTFRQGLRVKFDPNTFNHGTGGIAGMVPVESVAVDTATGAVRGDLQLIKSFPSFDYICDLAETMGSEFGLSIEFGGDPEDIGGVLYARCAEIYCVAIVDEPAANATGLWAVNRDASGVTCFRALEDNQTKPNQTTNMPLTAEDMTALRGVLTEGIKPLSDALAKLESDTLGRFTKMEGEFKTGLAKFETKEEDKEPSTAGMSAADVAAEELAAGVPAGESGTAKFRRINTYRASLNKPATVADINSAVSKGLATMFKNAGNRPVATNSRTEAHAADSGDGSAKAAWNTAVNHIRDNRRVTLSAATKLAMGEHRQLFRAMSDERQAGVPAAGQRQTTKATN